MEDEDAGSSRKIIMQNPLSNITQPSLQTAVSNTVSAGISRAVPFEANLSPPHASSKRGRGREKRGASLPKETPPKAVMTTPIVLLGAKPANLSKPEANTPVKILSDNAHKELPSKMRNFETSKMLNEHLEFCADTASKVF